MSATEQEGPRLLTTLQPHQQRAADKAKNNDLIAIHGMGSGKTLTSIAILHGIGKPGTVLTPAPLVTNYQKEIKKHVDGDLSADISSINRATKRKTDIPEGNTLVIDEAQGVRNADTGKGRYAWQQAQRAGRVVLLTGTPVYNNVADIAPLLNMVHRRKVLPTNQSEFQRQFVRDKIIEPGFWGKLRGVKPGVAQELTNTDTLRDLMRGHVDYYANRVGYPDVKEERVSVPFGERQDEVYQTIAGKAPFWVQYKIKNNLPPTKQEAQQLNSFLAGVRQASLSIKPYDKNLTPLQAAQASPKLMKAVRDITDGLKANPDFKAFSYSNYLDAGLVPMSAALTHQKVPHAMYHGSLSQKAKQDIVDRYNRGDLKVILGSSSASEGLDLKGTRLLQVLEPHFNNSKLRQVVGRAARYGSHTALPEDQRNVLVRYYHSKQKPGFLGSLFGKPDVRADEYIDNRAAEKDKLFKQMESLWQEEGVKAAAVAPLYHASPYKLDELQPMSTHGDPDVPAAVFATKHKQMALGYLGGKWGDRDLEQGGTSKGFHLREMRPGALEEVYGGRRAGYLYELPGDTFKRPARSRGSDFEVISLAPVKPIARTRITNLLDTLRASGVTLTKHDPTAPWYQAAVTRMRTRMHSMSPEGWEQYLKWVGETNPALRAELEKDASIVLATDNVRKRRELQAVLNGSVELEAPEDFEQVEETGRTFEQNARLKARAASKKYGKPALAEDSGLCVDALDGAPGVFTKRWTGGSEEANVKRLLNQLKGKPRRAKFTSALAYATPDGKVRTWTSSSEGRILEAPVDGRPRYDSVFYSLGLRGPHAGSRLSDRLATSALGRTARKFKAFLESENEERRMSGAGQ